MTTLEKALVIAACATAGAVYNVPTLVAVARLNPRVGRIALLNTCLGWTVVGWFGALMLARRRPPVAASSASEWTPWRPGRPEQAGPSAAAPSTYVDGSYLISESGSARTWAICTHGRWGIAFELDGTQRTACWVSTSDVPVDVLARALAHDSRRSR
jgi:hypothetical protein